MATHALTQQTYLPTSQDEIAGVLGFFKAHEAAGGRLPEPRYFLAGPNEGDRIDLPPTAYRVLLQVLEAMNAGKAVTVAPQSQLLTTQQAADLLGVSRPTVIKLIDRGELAAEIPGTTRRMIKLEDVIACRERRREAQLRAIFETSGDYDLDEDPADTAETLKRIRKEVAERRRARSTL